MPYQWYIALGYFISALTFLLLASLIYLGKIVVSGSLPKSWLITIYKKFNFVFFVLSLVQFSRYLLSLHDCKEKNFGDDYKFLRGYPSVRCYSQTHLIHSLVFLIGFVLYFIGALIYTIFYFNPQIKNGFPFNRNDSKARIWLFMVQILIFVLEIFIIKEKNKLFFFSVIVLAYSLATSQFLFRPANQFLNYTRLWRSIILTTLWGLICLFLSKIILFDNLAPSPFFFSTAFHSCLQPIFIHTFKLSS